MTIKRELDEFSLTEGERILIKGLGSGEPVAIGATSRPDANAGEDRQISGAFLRYVLTGGCEKLWEKCGRMPENGLRIIGARITGKLDLEGVKLDHDLALLYCYFDDAPLLRSTRLNSLSLQASRLPGVQADRLEAGGDVLLRGAQVEGAARLLGARLGGDLSCAGAWLKALNLQGAMVAGALFLRGNARVTGLLNLTDARVGSIVDAEESWPGQGNLVLDGCRYDRLGGTGSPLTAEARIKWLDLQDPAHWGVNFWPQPWEQCALVLREMGHAEEARKVLIEKEKRQRAALRRASGKAGSGSERALAWLLAVMVFAALSWEAGSLLSFAALSAGAAVLVAAHVPAIRDALFGALIAYGHRPRRAFLWLALAWFIGGVLSQAAADQGQIKPNNVRAVMSAAWSGCAGAANQPECFLEAPEGASYPRFSAWIYSADTLLPIVDLELQNYWIPAEEAGPLGAFARWFLWAQIAFGWALSLLAVAGFSGLIRRE